MSDVCANPASKLVIGCGSLPLHDGYHAGCITLDIAYISSSNEIIDTLPTYSRDITQYGADTLIDRKFTHILCERVRDDHFDSPSVTANLARFIDPTADFKIVMFRVPVARLDTLIDNCVARGWQCTRIERFGQFPRELHGADGLSICLYRYFINDERTDHRFDRRYRPSPWPLGETDRVTLLVQPAPVAGHTATSDGAGSLRTTPQLELPIKKRDLDRFPG